MSMNVDDDEMDDESTGYAPNVQDPSSSSTSLPKAKPKPKALSNKSKEKAQREAEMAKGRGEQTPNTADVVNVIESETTHPKPTKQPKYDKIDINELTNKNAELHYDNRRSYWSRQKRDYLKDQLLLRGHRFSHEGRVLHDGMLKLLYLMDDV